MYPDASITRMKANRITICGRNTITEPTPASTPWVRKSRTRLSGSVVVTPAISALIAASSASAKGVAQANTAWNITNRNANRIAGPAQGCSRTRSSPLARLWRAVLESVAPSAMCLALRRRSGVVRCQLRCGFSPACPPASAIAAVSASMPRRRTATVGTTGTPSASDRAAGSSVSPSRSAMSIMLSATTVGRPSSSTSCANTRCCSRLAASRTSTSTSGRASPTNSPWTTLRVTSSSGLAASKL